jgi:hypothetical protein
MRSDWMCAIAAVTVALASTISHDTRAEPLLTQGIGLQSCAKLASNLKPAAGLDHLPNALLFYWFQGYLSAANIYLLNEYSDYVDIAAVDEATITQLVSDYCNSNPDQKPITAIDKFIRDAKKIEAKESDAFDPWEH